MKIFIRFDKLENYSCDGTAFVPFVLRLRLPRKFLRASEKVEKSFCAFAFFIIYNHFLFSLFVIVQTEKKNPGGWKVKINLSTFLLLCTSCALRKWRKSFDFVFLLLNDFHNKIIIITRQFHDDLADKTFKKL